MDEVTKGWVYGGYAAASFRRLVVVTLQKFV